MADSTRGTGLKTSGMEKVMRSTQTIIHTLGISRTEKRMGKEYIPGETERSTTDNGTMDLSKGPGCGKEDTEIRTLGSGRTPRPMDMVFISGPTGTGMKDSGSFVSSTGSELIYSQMVTPISGPTIKGSPMGEERTSGGMVLSSRGISIEV